MFYFHQTLLNRRAAQPYLIQLNNKWSRVVHKAAAFSQPYALNNNSNCNNNQRIRKSFAKSAQKV